MNAITSNAPAYFGSRIVPMLQKKLGGAWKRFVTFWVTGTNEVRLQFRKIDKRQLADVQGALFNLARAGGFNLSSWQRGRRYSLTA